MATSRAHQTTTGPSAFDQIDMLGITTVDHLCDSGGFGDPNASV